MKKATPPNIVSRLDNEEITIDKDGSISSEAERYNGDDDRQPNSGLESHSKLSYRKQTLKDLEKGKED